MNLAQDHIDLWMSRQIAYQRQQAKRLAKFHND